MKPLAPIAAAGFAALALAAAGPAQADTLQLTQVDTDAAAAQTPVQAQDIGECDLNLGSTGVGIYSGFLFSNGHIYLGSVDVGSSRPDCYLLPPLPLGSVYVSFI
ncbi:hypothetical protein [Nocardia stercoris]|uniref:Secreted protein n=1 Tax=Nocardia stercoris TaxID=2483361 RepID=A0A3M2LF82_9NOCA|nr:hypothetical protein [Nocardia stercoris]RMI35233.1 hypothetical protein EBN03_02785 [Nocardia stercoris]